jgi:D-serine deaminase-like pyridoxal phosphate-dependent protein
MNLCDLPSPCVVISAPALERNLRAMQKMCDSSGIELWPHVKTHKLVPVLRRQLELGATGATSAKLGEAEALLESGVRRIFLAHSLADLRQAPRLRRLAAQLDAFVLAVTSDLQCEALERILQKAELRLPVLMAVDTGLGREGVRGAEAATFLAARIRRSSHMDLIGLYTHEGHAYQAISPAEARRLADEVYRHLLTCSEAVGGNLPLWPGCSVTAGFMAGRDRVKVVRPGSYVFGDLFLTESTGVTSFADVALNVLATVVDRPVKDLALIDAGSKTFSNDRTPDGILARCVERPGLLVTRLSEEHGFLSGPGVNELQLGERLRFIPAHVCPVVNLASQVHVLQGQHVVNTWNVDARGRSD